MLISDVLLTGTENAIPGREICKILNITARELTLSVARERRAGVPICASSDAKNPGYYLAADQGEMQRFCDSLSHRAGEIYKTWGACIKSKDNLPAGEA